MLSASDLNAEFNNLLTNARDLVSPLTGVLDMNGFELIMDGDADSSLTADTDDRIDVRLGGVDLFFLDGTTASCVNGLTWTGVITGARPRLSATGSDTNIGVAVRPKGTGAGASVVLEDGSGNEVLIGDVATASAVNEVTVTNAATATRPRVAASGGDTNIGLAVRPKGTGAGASVIIEDGSGNEVLIGGIATASAVNEVTVTNAATTTAPIIESTGGDTHVGLTLRPKGSALLDIPISCTAGGKNIAARTDASTPNSKINITADEITLSNSSSQSIRVSTVSLTSIDITASGANGLDTGAEASNTWYYGWAIYNPTTRTTAGLLSVSATAPTMPSGYTFKALVTAVRNNGSSNFVAYRQFGNEVKYLAAQSALSGGTATAETTVTITSLVPSIALAFTVFCNVTGVADGSGNWDMSATMRHTTGLDFFSHEWTTNGVIAASAQRQVGGEVHLPNTGSFFYLISTTAGASNTFNIGVLGFKLPLGGE